jgi:predicted nucleotidyltransferase
VAAYLFGSAAAGRATDLSDIDIALVLEQAQFLSSDRLEMELEIEDQIVRVCEIAKADV